MDPTRQLTRYPRARPSGRLNAVLLGWTPRRSGLLPALIGSAMLAVGCGDSSGTVASPGDAGSAAAAAGTGNDGRGADGAAGSEPESSPSEDGGASSGQAGASGSHETTAGRTGTGDNTGSGGGSATGGSSGSGGAPSTSGGASSSESCEPADLTSWEPPPYVPANPAQDVCTSEQVARFHDDCLLGDDCAAFELGGDDAACGGCLWPSGLDENRYGPVLEANPRPFYRWETNHPGCVELLGEVDCARKIQAAQACAREACVHTCDSPATPEYTACVDAARSGACQEYEADAVCILSQAVADQCAGGGFETMVSALGAVFCGGKAEIPE